MIFNFKPELNGPFTGGPYDEEDLIRRPFKLPGAHALGRTQNPRVLQKKRSENNKEEWGYFISAVMAIFQR